MGMKVLMITRYFHPFLGGNENQCYLLARYLTKKDIDVTVVSSRYKRDLLRDEKLEGLDVTRLTHFSRIYNYSKRNHLKRIVRYLSVLLAEWTYMLRLFLYLLASNKKYDVFHVHKASWIAVPVVFAGKILKKRVYIKIADINELSESKLVLIPRVIILRLYRKSIFFAISTEIMNELIELGFKSNQIKFIFNGLEVAEKKLSIHRRTNEILFVGNYVHKTKKGLDILLEASKKVVKIFPDTKFIIAGDGNPALFEGVADDNIINNNFRFLGRISNVKDYLEQSTIFVLPSRREGMSNSLLEAMSQGIPSIASNISGNNDIIDHNINGLLFESGDHDTLAKMIIDLLSDKEKRDIFSINAQQKIKTVFDIDVISKKYIEAYTK